MREKRRKEGVRMEPEVGQIWKQENIRVGGVGGGCDGVRTLKAVSIKTSIKTLPCPCTESEYISVH